MLDQPRGPDMELRMEPEDVQYVVEPAGFTFKKVVDIGPYHYGAVFAKSTDSWQEKTQMMEGMQQMMSGKMKSEDMPGMMQTMMDNMFK